MVKPYLTLSLFHVFTDLIMREMLLREINNIEVEHAYSLFVRALEVVTNETASR